MTQATLIDYEGMKPTKPTDLYLELGKKGMLESQRGRTLRVLIDGQPHHRDELVEIAAQYNARVYELRCLGCNIQNLTDEKNQTDTYFQMDV